MAPLFSAVSFIALITTAVSGVVWIVKKIRHRPTKAHIICIVAAVTMIAGFVAFGLTYEPPEKVETPTATDNTKVQESEPEETEELPQEAPEATEQPTEPMETVTETPTAPPETEEAPEVTTNTETAPKPTEPQAEATETAATEPPATEPPAHEPVATPETEPEIVIPAPEHTEEIDPVERDMEEIETAARDIVTANYTMTDISRVTVNENYGTDADGDYVLLVYATWNVKNSVSMTKKMLAMYSEDFAARVGKDIPKVSDFTVFWTVPYYSEKDTAVKYSYGRVGNGMTETDHMIMIK